MLDVGPAIFSNGRDVKAVSFSDEGIFLRRELIPVWSKRNLRRRTVVMRLRLLHVRRDQQLLEFGTHSRGQYGTSAGSSFIIYAGTRSCLRPRWTSLTCF